MEVGRQRPAVEQPVGYGNGQHGVIRERRILGVEVEVRVLRRRTLEAGANNITGNRTFHGNFSSAWYRKGLYAV